MGRRPRVAALAAVLTAAACSAGEQLGPPPPGSEVGLALAPGSQITSFGEDALGALYLVTSDGKVHKVVPE